jgi:signal peptidase II
MQESRKELIRRVFLALVVIASIVTIDIQTKSWASSTLAPNITIQMAKMPLTLAFNQGVAFGLRLPTAGRWMIIFATLLVLAVLSNMFVRAQASDWTRLMALQLVSAGAIGNLIDRVRWNGGVVDFIGPFDIGSMQFPIFNVADMAITTGAILLALSLLRENEEMSHATSDEPRALDMDMDGTVG